MKKHLLLTSIFLGIAFDILFWEKESGISFFIFIALCLAAGYLLLRAQNIHPDKRKSSFKKEIDTPHSVLIATP